MPYYVFFANVWPVPAFPLNVIPYLFLVTMLIAVGWFLSPAATSS
ncbi:hypothetical protein [Microbacterium terrisoli]|jgi:hypothetical protein|nr:hypothetical protein [Microbacterium protaetiae]